MLRWPKTRRPRYGRLREARKWGGRRGEAKWVVVWGRRGNGELKLWKRGRLQWLASIDLPCGAILPPYATGVDHPSATPLPPSVGVTPLEAEADILKNDSESHRGPHWRFLAGSTRPPGPPDIPLFFALGLSLGIRRAREEKADARQKEGKLSRQKTRK